MTDKSLELFTEEDQKYFDEFHRCQTMEDVRELQKRYEKLNESRGPVEIPYLDMTYAEFLEKYNCVDSEEIRRKYGL